MQKTIRTVSVTDAPAICELSLQLGYPVSEEDVAAHIRQILLQNDHCVFAALDREAITGWVHAFAAVRIETKPFVEIGGLVVDERYRGQGIGKALVDKVKEWCLGRNIHSLRLRCNTKRTAAHRFYNHIGFLESKEQKVFEMQIP